MNSLGQVSHNEIEPGVLNNHRILKQLAKALIRLRECAGWSEPLLVAHTTLLEISCTGSNVFARIAEAVWSCSALFVYDFC